MTVTRPFCQRCGVEWEMPNYHTCPSIGEKTFQVLAQIAGLLERLDGRLANISSNEDHS